MLIVPGKKNLFKGLTAGRINRIIAIIVIGPAMGRVKKTEKSPFDIRSDWRNAGSAIGPNTMASTAGASG